MSHDELLAKLSNDENGYAGSTPFQRITALRAVVELHKPSNFITKNGETTEQWCTCGNGGLNPYPCPTIQAIQKELT